MYFAGISATIVFRICVFVKQVTVSDEILIYDTQSAAGNLTLRDAWEFCVDIIFLRYVYVAVGRIKQPADTLGLGPSYGQLTELP